MLEPDPFDEEEDSDNPNQPVFESIKEAANFFAKNARTEWIW
jgi:hypothetical protein